MSRFDGDQFLKDLYEEPRSEFAVSLWDQLTAQDKSPASAAGTLPVDSQQTMIQEKRMMMESVEHTNGRQRDEGLNLAVMQVVRSPTRRRSGHRLFGAATSLVLVLGLSIAFILAQPLGSGNPSVHWSSLGAQVTPTAGPTETSPLSEMDEETVAQALLSVDRPLPVLQLDLGSTQSPTNFSLNAEHSAVQLRFSGQVNTRVAITLELAAYFPQTGIAIRLSRDTGAELQPLLIFKPEQLVSLPVDFPVAYVDRDNKTALIVELLTPLEHDEEIVFRAYLGSAWLAAGDLTPVKVLSCADYRTYCVPLTGGGEGEFAALESPSSRLLDQYSAGAPGVIRGISSAGVPIIGSPDAPLHLAVFQDFSSIPDANFYLNDLQVFIIDYVLTGQASVELYLVSDPAEEFSQVAAQAAFAAGEQGAFWEMTLELFELAKSGGGARYAFNWSNIPSIGLDREALIGSALSGRYDDLLNRSRTVAEAHGIVDMPTVLYQTPAGEWQLLPDHSYEALSLAARAPDLLERTRPVMIILDPQTIGQVSYGLQEGDHATLSFDLTGLEAGTFETLGISEEAEQAIFEGLLLGVGYYPSPQLRRESFLKLVFAVPADQAETVVILRDTELPVTIQLVDSD